jgi:predicted nucleic acid-binding protein
MRVLVDTNILVRSVQRTHPLMRTARNALRVLYQQGNDLCVTPQNIAEFWNVCTRPVNANGLENSISATNRLASRIETFFSVIPDSMESFRQWRTLIVVHEVKGAKVHDARLVAIMQVHGLKHLLTFNAADFKRYENIITVHPATLAA